METKICSRALCPHGGTPQPIDEFYIRYGRPISECRTCSIERARQSAERLKESRRLYMRDYYQRRKAGLVDVKSPKSTEEQLEDRKRHNQKYYEKFRQDPDRIAKQRAYQKEWAKSPHGKAYKRKVEEDSVRIGRRAAIHAVRWAVAAGKLAPTKVCSLPGYGGIECGGPVEWHHYNGYDYEHWLDVEEVCKRHHHIRDKERRHRETNSPKPSDG